MSNLRILIASSIADEQTSLADMLRRVPGHDILTAANGDDAYASALQQRPDVIVADYELPPTDGLELCCALQRAGLSVPVILIVTEGSETLAVECLRAGIADYVKKPINAEQLLAAVQRARAKTAGVQAAYMANGLLENVKEAIIAADAQGNLIFCNAAARRLFDLADIPLPSHHPLAEIIPNAQVLELFTRESRLDRDWRSEITPESGGPTWNAQLTEIENVGRVVVMQDISQLKELDRIKSDFVSRVSRDIRSPLTTILGYVELIGRIGPVNEHQRRFIERITFSVRSIATLLSDLMELTQIEAGFDTDLESTQLEMIVRYAVEGSRQKFEVKQQTLHVAIPERAPAVLGQSPRLRQMVHILLDNAAKFTPERGRIEVSLETQGDFLVLRISDNGIGIPAEDQPHVFEKFYRGRNVVEQFEGAGLGLSIVKSIVDRHNGRVWLESQPGIGTVFTIMLPTYDGEQHQEPTTASGIG